MGWRSAKGTTRGGGLDRWIHDEGRSGPSDPDKGRSRHKGGFGGRREPTVGIHKEVIQRRLRVLVVRTGPKEVLTAKEESREVLATRVNLREVLAAKRRC